MATENEPNTTIQQPSKEQESAESQTGIVRKPHDAGIERSQRPRGSGFPLNPYEMLRMTPFGLFRRMTEEFDRVLQPLISGDEANVNIAWTPTVEISEREGKYHVLAELPGLSPNQMRVEVEDHALVLQGERKEEHETTEGGVHRSERQFGFFYRRVPLPEGADPRQARATFHDGILEITVPAPKQKTETRQIQIEADTKSSSGETKQAAA
jgi:HSP20 family protein